MLFYTLVGVSSIHGLLKSFNLAEALLKNNPNILQNLSSHFPHCLTFFVPIMSQNYCIQQMTNTKRKKNSP